MPVVNSIMNLKHSTIVENKVTLKTLEARFARSPLTTTILFITNTGNLVLENVFNKKFKISLNLVVTKKKNFHVTNSKIQPSDIINPAMVCLILWIKVCPSVLWSQEIKQKIGLIMDASDLGAAMENGYDLYLGCMTWTK